MNLSPFYLLALVFIISYSCQSSPKRLSIIVQDAEPTSPLIQKVQANAHSVFTIKGMSCQMGCANKIQNALSKKEGVQMVNVDFQTETMTIDYDSTQLDQVKIAKLVSEVDKSYSATLK